MLPKRPLLVTSRRSKVEIGHGEVLEAPANVGGSLGSAKYFSRLEGQVRSRFWGDDGQIVTN